MFNGRYGEQVRFLLAGGINATVAYALFALGLWLLTPLFSIEHSYLLIQWIAWIVSVPFGAFTLKYFAFRASGPYLPQALRSYLVYLPVQLASWGLLAFFTIVGGLHPLVAQLVAMAIATIISYLGHKFFTFSGNS